MKTLNFNEMENVEGGAPDGWLCAGGFAGLGFMAIGSITLAIVNPGLAGAVLLSGEGAGLAAAITVNSLILIEDNC